MTLLPVIAREMRAAARQPFTYYMRTLSAGALLLVSLAFAMDRGFGPNRGGALFAYLQLALFLTIWGLVPILTADCISRERREGTLGLLFLTGLGASEIAVAKCLSHGLRALTLWLAVLPGMMVPILMGGVSWNDGVMAVLVDVTSICGALAAGLLASTRSKERLRTLVWAVVFALAFLWLLSCAYRLAAMSPPPVPSSIRTLGPQPGVITYGPAAQVYYVPARTGPTIPNLAISAGISLPSLMRLTLVATLGLGLTILIAGAAIRRVWQEEPSLVGLWWQRVFCTPILMRGFLHRWMRWKLQRNPIGWLEQRTWTGRSVTWGWLAVVVSLYSILLTDSHYFMQSNELQKLIGWLIVGSMAMTATGSFRRERESGLMELLLVSPVPEQQIILGRLRGLWGQFLPSAGMLLGLWAFLSTLPGAISEPGTIVFFIGTFLTLPIIGLYYSLRCRNYIVALLATLAVGLLLPALLQQITTLLFWFAFSLGTYTSSSRPFVFVRGIFSVWTLLCQLVLAIVYETRLHRRLQQRSFPLGRQDL